MVILFFIFFINIHLKAEMKFKMSQLEKEIKEKNTTIQNMKLNLESSQKRGKTNNGIIN